MTPIPSTICKQCGTTIQDERYDDFCGDDCLEVHEAIKALEYRFAAQEGH